MAKTRPLFSKKLPQTKPTTNWCDAFVESYNTEDIQKTVEGAANALKITKATSCTQYTMILAYVSQFTLGGFWLSDEGLFFVTKGVGSDEEATYKDAKDFIRQWNNQ